MGSGLILLVIVVAWLAVLVPMFLRSHESAAALKSADKFGDAMRVLSRRGVAQGRDVLVPRRSRGAVVSEPPAAPVPAAPRVARTAAQRRARLLLTLVVLAVLTLVGGLVGPRSVLVLHGVTDLLLVAFVVHLRTQARLRAERRRRLARLARRRPPAVRVAGVPDRMPARPVALRAPLPAPAARHDEPVPLAGTGTGGSSWSPVPVPLPTYVGKAVAPARPTRVLDLTRPGAWSAGLDDDLVDTVDAVDEHDLEDLIDRRKAVNGW